MTPSPFVTHFRFTHVCIHVHTPVLLLVSDDVAALLSCFNIWKKVPKVVLTLLRLLERSTKCCIVGSNSLVLTRASPSPYVEEKILTE